MPSACERERHHVRDGYHVHGDDDEVVGERQQQSALLHVALHEIINSSQVAVELERLHRKP